MSMDPNLQRYYFHIKRSKLTVLNHDVSNE
jgi:hypothetical protein